MRSIVAHSRACFVQSDLNEPGAEFGLLLEFGNGFPQLNNNFLEKIFPVSPGLTVNVADLLNNTLVGLYLPDKFVLCH